MCTKCPAGRLLLRTLDIFSGCGGLSEGLHQAGVAETKWAIEYEEAAARAFEENHKDASMFCDNSCVILRRIMEENGCLDDCCTSPEAVDLANDLPQLLVAKLPKPGEVDFICGGPPCQGYSGMNRFNQSEWSMAQNSMVIFHNNECIVCASVVFLHLIVLLNAT